MNDCYTVTFGFRAENHARNQIVGDATITSMTTDRLIEVGRMLREKGVEHDMINLWKLLPKPAPPGPPAPRAMVLVVRDGVGQMLESVDKAALYAELKTLRIDTKCLIRGRVVNKKARYCTTVADFDQEPDYEDGKGTVNNFNNFPILNAVRALFASFLGVPPSHLMGEVNHYYNADECGIGFHGDAERADPCYGGGFTAGLRVGPGAKGFPLRYIWYENNRAIGTIGELYLDECDMYIMDEKAMGGDFRKSSIKTLRHSAGKHPKWAQLSGVMAKEGKNWPKKKLYPLIKKMAVMKQPA